MNHPVRLACLLATSITLAAGCSQDPPPPKAAPAAPPKPVAVAPAAPAAQAQPVVQQVKLDANAELAARVRKALENASAGTGQGVDVSAAGGVVRLWGTVPSAAAKRELEKLAAATPGVLSVESKLVIVRGS